jgi:hypothetical protein
MCTSSVLVSAITAPCSSSSSGLQNLLSLAQAALNNTSADAVNSGTATAVGGDSTTANSAALISGKDYIIHFAITWFSTTDAIHIRCSLY